MSPDSSLERLATLRAEIEATGDRASVLERAGISGRAWIELQRKWLADLSAECEAGESDLRTRYLRAFRGEAPAAPASPTAPTELPSYMRQRSEASSMADPDATLPIPAPGTGAPALPFSPASSNRHALESIKTGPAAPTDPGSGETALLPQVELTSLATGTFRDRLAPLVVPILSLEEYAEARARLTVYGEDHAPTLARFGITSPDVRDALRARFADYFKRDPEAQGRFLSAMQLAIGRVRAEREQNAAR